jgi:hypothetical protein
MLKVSLSYFDSIFAFYFDVDVAGDLGTPDIIDVEAALPGIAKALQAAGGAFWPFDEELALFTGFAFAHGFELPGIFICPLPTPENFA